MGQAFRRATGRIGSSSVDAASSQLKKPIDRRPPPVNKTPADNVGPVAGMPFAFSNSTISIHLFRFYPLKFRNLVLIHAAASLNFLYYTKITYSVQIKFTF